jgi:hypothetical protein
MEELLELRAAVEQHRYNDALYIIADMEEMAREDKINKIESYLVVLLAHLVKQHAEQRSTPSWRRSIRNSVLEIRKTNKRRSAGGAYMDAVSLQTAIDEYFHYALRDAADEAFAGTHTAKQLAAMISAEAIKAEALDYILNGLPESED